MKRHLVFLIMLCLFFLSGCRQELRSACINENCFQVETADTPEQRAEGLMYRTRLDEDRGMLFIFEHSGQYNFWMKNTLIPLDIIWINENKTIVYINENTPPCEQDPCPSYGLQKQAKYVLEINAGLSEKQGIKTGDTVSIS